MRQAAYLRSYVGVVELTPFSAALRLHVRGLSDCFRHADYKAMYFPLKAASM